jgi:hypothetical protein
MKANNLTRPLLRCRNVFGDSFTVDVIVHILRCDKEMMEKSLFEDEKD